MSAEKQITFRASIPQMMSAIKTGGDGLRVTFDVPESDVADATALIALRNCALRITVEYDSNPHATKPVEKPKDEKPIKLKIAKPKGEFSRYWQEMFKAGFQNFPDLHQVLQVSAPDVVKEAIKAELDVTSLTFVSPEQFEGWCEAYHLESLITLSRQAAIKGLDSGI